ncbi:MAG TPA: antitoxin Xre/MbcA/ParS toxin-binding domain-containing protein [Polyangiaceae bacterium]|nr:antitoxin Xre/MbcA/ParS toxin-binding domain-containing protein [Polyangiaceae bacterium]
MAQAAKAAADPSREERMQAFLGGAKVLRRPASTLLQLHAAAERGLHVLVIDALSKSLQASREDLLDALAVSPRTFTRRLKAGLLSPEESDRAMRLARVAAQAEEVLGGRDEAVTWLHRTNRSLGGHKPFELVRTDAGAELVVDVLGRLEHGVFG